MSSKIFLYVKECEHCGLKYFGKTIKTNPFSYYGSGLRWKKHYKKYGKEKIKTIEIYPFDDIKEAKEFALNFSIKNNIIKSKKWANLINENGEDGFPEKEENPMFNSKRFGNKNPFYGKTHNFETKKIIKEKRKHQIITKETKKKMSEKQKNSIWINNKLIEKTIFKFEKIPEGFVVGRKPFNKKWKELISKNLGKNKGKKYYNDGIKNYLCLEENSNPTWSKGMIKRKI